MPWPYEPAAVEPAAVEPSQPAAQLTADDDKENQSNAMLRHGIYHAHHATL